MRRAAASIRAAGGFTRLANRQVAVRPAAAARTFASSSVDSSTTAPSPRRTTSSANRLEREALGTAQTRQRLFIELIGLRRCDGLFVSTDLRRRPNSRPSLTSATTRAHARQRQTGRIRHPHAHSSVRVCSRVCASWRTRLARTTIIRSPWCCRRDSDRTYGTSTARSISTSCRRIRRSTKVRAPMQTATEREAALTTLAG